MAVEAIRSNDHEEKGLEREESIRGRASENIVYEINLCVVTNIRWKIFKHCVVLYNVFDKYVLFKN